MSKDLVTYYGQTERIDQLVDKYGVYLEQLNRETNSCFASLYQHTF